MIRMLLITLLSLLQTVTGSYLVYGIVQLNRGGAAAEQVGGIGNLIFVAVILAGLGFLVSKLRNFDVFIIVGVLLEVLLSPVAFPRVVLSWIFCMIFKVQIEPEMDEFDFDEALDMVFGYLFYVDLETDGEISPVTNFFTQLLLCVPVAAAGGFCAYRFVYNIATSCSGGDALLTYFYMMGSTFFPFLLCGIRKIPTEVVTGFDREFVFKNRYTDAKVTKKASGEYYIDPTEESKEAGWERVSGGYTSSLTSRFIFSILFSPVLALTQAIGAIIALVGIFAPHIYSCYGMIDFDDVSCPFLQRILHFFFSFVFV